MPRPVRSRPRPAGAARRPSLSPMLAVPADAATLGDGSRYAFEFKWDGMRALVHCAGGRTRIESRNGNDVTEQFPELQPIAAALGHDAVLDGEIVALDGKGRPDFGRLQDRMHLTRAAEVTLRAFTTPVHFVAFDLLSLDGDSLVQRPYKARRARLEGLAFTGPAWGTSPARMGSAQAMLAVSRRMGLEGIMAKLLTSRYAPGERSPAWLKIRNRARQEFVVGGWSDGEGARGGTVGSLLVGYYEGTGRARKLRFAGKVGSGYKDADLEFLMPRLRELRQDRNPFAVRGDGPGEAPDGPGIHWVRPELVAEVDFNGLSRHGVLRQPSFKGLRTDKDPRQVVWEQAGEPWHAHSGAARSASAS